MGESTPPAMMVLRTPPRMWRKAYPMASVEDVQPVETMWLRPRKPNRIDTSLASVPMVPVGMVYTLHCFWWPV